MTKASSEEQFRKALDAEATELTRIGNTFRIRHSEVNQIEIQSTAHIDYLFHRIFSLIHLLLRSTGRLA